MQHVFFPPILSLYLNYVQHCKRRDEGRDGMKRGWHLMETKGLGSSSNGTDCSLSSVALKSLISILARLGTWYVR